MIKNQKQWTIVDILNSSVQFLKHKNIENPRLNAEQLLAHILRISRVQLYLQFDQLLKKDEINEYRELLIRRINDEPLQYITGVTEFMGLKIQVSSDVLIPRPETELLVEITLELKKEFHELTKTIWDVGTGSGCIAISLAHFWPECSIIATDVSLPAISIAKKNAQNNQINDNIKFFHHDILKDKLIKEKNVDVIVSNPPYVSIEEFSMLSPEIRNYEPGIALTDYGNGLLFYKKILSLLKDYSDCKYILFELSGFNPEEVLKLIQHYSFPEVSVHKDLNNISRVVKIRVK
jgi:release factor glutamine methyltransferase